MKILCICQALDLGIEDIGVTPAWWQLMKGLHTLGIEVLAVPYYGREVQSLWWRALRNPNQGKNLIYQSFESVMARLPNYRTKTQFRKKNARILARIARRTAAPKWRNFLEGILKSQRDLAAILLFNLPLNHLTNVFGGIGKKYRIPVIAYDGDMPTSLPKYGGVSFSPYVGADLSEFDAIITNSKGGVKELTEMGATKAFTVYYGADPEAFCPVSNIDQDIDVSFYGVGSAFREVPMGYMIEQASNLLPHRKFVVSGPHPGKPLGRAIRERIPYRELVSRSRVNLNIVRDSHTRAYASSTSRPFELASMASCIVSNDYEGLGEWFEEGREIRVVRDRDEAVKLYEWLIENDSIRKATGQAARERVIKQHTYLHRAREILEIVNSLC